MLAGICLYAGVLHLFVGLRRDPIDRIHISFALVCFLIALQDLFGIQGYIARALPVYVATFKWQIALYSLASIPLIWFVYYYTRVKAKRFMIGLSGTWIVVILIHLLVFPNGILFAETYGIFDLLLPWGETVTALKAQVNGWRWVLDIMRLSTAVFTLYACYQQYQRGERKPALILGISLAIFWGTVLYDSFVDIELIESIYTLAFGFMAIVVIMSLSLANDVVKSGFIQQDLVESERRWRSLIDTVSLIVAGVDKNGAINVANPYFLNLTGYDEQEIMGKDWFQALIPAGERSELTEFVEQAMEEGDDVHRQNAILTKAGEERMIDWTNVPLFDRQGESIGLVGIGSDMTARLRAQMELQNYKDHLEELVKQRTEELTKAVSELQTLNTISETVSTEHELSEALTQICSTVTEVFGATATAVSLLNDDRTQLTTIARFSSQMDDPLQGIGNLFPWDNQGAMQKQLTAGKTAVFANAQTHPNLALNHAFFRERGIWGMMVIPLRSRGEVIGMMSVQLNDPERTFTQEEQRLGETIAGYVTSAIENARLAEQEQEAAAGRERQRLARELHDNVSQTLFSASLIATALPAMWQKKPEMAAQNTEKLRQLTRGAQAEMRTLLIELRPMAIAEGQMDTLLTYLGDALVGKTSAQVDILVDGDYQLPPDVQVALYRITQEALNNIRKHAQATEVMVHLDCGKGETAVLVIRDNGVGFETESVPAGHFGVGIMAERAEAINAQIAVTSQLGEGTEIRVKWKG